jgi:hypothetical protein
MPWLEWDEDDMNWLLRYKINLSTRKFSSRIITINMGARFLQDFDTEKYFLVISVGSFPFSPKAFQKKEISYLPETLPWRPMVGSTRRSGPGYSGLSG